jgi:hypothetical protein
MSNNQPIKILDTEIDKENFPILYDWALKDRDGLEKRIQSDLRGSEKAETLLVMLEVDLKEQRLK